MSEISPQHDHGKRNTLLALLAGMGIGASAVGIVQLVSTDNLEYASAVATDVDYSEFPGPEADTTLIAGAVVQVAFRAPGEVSLDDARSNVQQRFYKETIAGYSDPPGLYAYKVQCQGNIRNIQRFDGSAYDFSCDFNLYEEGFRPVTD